MPASQTIFHEKNYCLQNDCYDPSLLKILLKYSSQYVGLIKKIRLPNIASKLTAEILSSILCKKTMKNKNNKKKNNTKYSK